MSEPTFVYDGDLYPSFLRDGNAMQYISPIAQKFCLGRGVDVGCGPWPLPGAIPIEMRDGGDAMNLPLESFDYVASSHCLEHLVDPIAALEHWRDRLRPGGCLFIYLPHPDQKYWRPSRCRKHLHSWKPEEMAQIVRDLGFRDVIHSERDMAWSFCVVGFRG